ncbi:MAG: hypothetical protein R3320_05215 [Nitriliruptorales bacterium]|nr:hypothetical protein [Nitriliruptorales bacterium]
MRRIFTTAAMVIGLVLVMALPAFAGDCVNESRPAPDDPSQFQVVGNWVWFPGFGWSFLPPGSDLSEFAGAPGANGNFHNDEHAHALLHDAAACDNPNRQTEHGIQRTELFDSC